MKDPNLAKIGLNMIMGEYVNQIETEKFAIFILTALLLTWRTVKEHT